MRKATFLIAEKATSLFAKKPTLLVAAYTFLPNIAGLQNMHIHRGCRLQHLHY